MRQARPSVRTEPAGLGTRQAAADVLGSILDGRRTLDEALQHHGARPPLGTLQPRDRAFVRSIVATSLRRRGQIEDVLARFLAKPLPKDSGRARAILVTATAQLLFLGTSAHAAVDQAVALASRDAGTRRFAKLVNAVLRRVAHQGPAITAVQDAPRLNTPEWLWRGWEAAYGPETTRQIATRHLETPPLDLTVADDASGWAERLGGVLLPTGSVRICGEGRIADLPGFAEGVWWVQDAAAALPARLLLTALGEPRGRRVLDLCAAPGGKTMQLAAAGAHVTALDQSQSRLDRVAENLRRTRHSAELVVADALTWRPAQRFDAVLLDAPCSATGTLRRHPDAAHLKSRTDIESMAAVQTRLLDAAAAAVSPGGVLVYCTCSLEPEEGSFQARAFSARHGNAFAALPFRAGEAGFVPEWLDGSGHLRTLPSHLASLPEGMKGMDGFFAARWRRIGVTSSV